MSQVQTITRTSWRCHNQRHKWNW